MGAIGAILGLTKILTYFLFFSAYIPIFGSVFYGIYDDLIHDRYYEICNVSLVNPGEPLCKFITFDFPLALYGFILGAIIGAIIGLIIGKIKSKKQKNKLIKT